MAIERDSLEVQIEIRTNSKATEKELASVEKELASLSKAVSRNSKDFDELARVHSKLHKELRVSDKEMTDLTKTVQRLETSMQLQTEETTKELSKLNKEMRKLKNTVDATDVRGFSTQMTILSGAISALGTAFDKITRTVSAVSDFFVALDLLTSPQMLARMAGLLDLLADVSRQEGLLIQAKGFQMLSGKVAQFAVVAEKLRKRFKIDELFDAAALESKGFSKILTDTTVETLSGLETLDQVLQTVLISLRGTGQAMDVLRVASIALKTVLKSVLTPQTISTLRAFRELILVTLSAIALTTSAFATFSRTMAVGAKQADILSRLILRLGGALGLSQTTMAKMIFTLQEFDQAATGAISKVRQVIAGFIGDLRSLAQVVEKSMTGMASSALKSLRSIPQVLSEISRFLVAAADDVVWLVTNFERIRGIGPILGRTAKLFKDIGKGVKAAFVGDVASALSAVSRDALPDYEDSVRRARDITNKFADVTDRTFNFKQKEAAIKGIRQSIETLLSTGQIDMAAALFEFRGFEVESSTIIMDDMVVFLEDLQKQVFAAADDILGKPKIIQLAMAFKVPVDDLLEDMGVAAEKFIRRNKPLRKAFIKTGDAARAAIAPLEALAESITKVSNDLGIVLQKMGIFKSSSQEISTVTRSFKEAFDELGRFGKAWQVTMDAIRISTSISFLIAIEGFKNLGREFVQTINLFKTGASVGVASLNLFKGSLIEIGVLVSNLARGIQTSSGIAFKTFSRAALVSAAEAARAFRGTQRAWGLAAHIMAQASLQFTIVQHVFVKEIVASFDDLIVAMDFLVRRLSILLVTFTQSLRTLTSFSKALAEATGASLGLGKVLLEELPGAIKALTRLITASALTIHVSISTIIGTANSLVAAFAGVLVSAPFEALAIKMGVSAAKAVEAAKTLGAVVFVITNTWLRLMEVLFAGFGIMSTVGAKSLGSLSQMILKVGGSIGVTDNVLRSFLITVDEVFGAIQLGTGKGARAFAQFTERGIFSFTSVGTAAKEFMFIIIEMSGEVARAGLLLAKDLGEKALAVASKFTTSAGVITKAAGGIVGDILEIPLALGRIKVNAIFNLVETLSLASVGLEFLGNVLIQTDSLILKFIGSVALLASKIAEDLLFGFRNSLTAVGKFLRLLGVQGIKTFIEFTEVSEKALLVIKQFDFAVKSFGKTLGTQFVGDLDFWQAKIEEVKDNTIFFTKDITKAITNLTKESKILGLTADKTALILERSAEIAAANGAEIEDVTQAIISALTGQSQALLGLGVDLRQSTVLHGEAAEGIRGFTEEQRSAALQTVRYNELLAQTNPLVGSAALQLNTLTGQVIRLDRAYEELQISLGKATGLQVLGVGAAAKLLEALNKLPEVLIQITGGILSWGSALLIGAGFIIQYAILISGLGLTFGVLSTLMATNITVQNIMTASFTRLGAVMGVQTVFVNSLAAAFTNLLIVMKGAVFRMIPSLIAAMGTLLLAIKAVTVALFKMLIPMIPIIAKIALVVIVVFAVVVAFQQLSQTLEPFTEALGQIVSSFGMMGTALGATSEATGEATKSIGTLIKNGLFRLFQMLIDVAKVLITVFARAVLGAIKLIFKAQKVWARWTKSNEAAAEAIEQLDADIANLQGNLDELKQAGDEAAISFIEFGSSAADGALETKLFGDEVEKMAAKMEVASTTFDKIGAGAKRIKQVLESLTETNRSLRLEIATVGSSGVAEIQQRLKFDLKSIELTEQKLAAEKALSGEVKAQLDIQRELVGQKAEVDTAKLRLESLTAVLGKNKEIEDELAVSSLRGIARENKKLEIAQKILDKRIEAAQADDKGPKVIAGLERQKKLVDAMSKRNIFNKALDGLNQMLAKEAQLRDDLSLIGLEGEELADAQLALEKAKVDAALNRLRIEDAITTEAIASANKQKKLLDDIHKKKKEGGDEGIDFAAGAEAFAGGIGDSVDILMAGSEAASENFGQALTQQSNKMLNGFTQIPDMMESMADNFAESMSGFLDRAPEFIDKLFSALPRIIDKLVLAFMDLFERLPGLFLKIADKLPALIEKIMSALPQLISGLLTAIPQIVAALFTAVPDVLVKILQGLPDIISALIEGLIGASGEIIGAFIDEFVTKGGAVKIAFAIVHAVIQSIGAILTGISKGIQRAMKGIFSGFEIPPVSADKFVKKLEDGIAKVVTSASGIAEDAFAVIDIPGVGDGQAKPEDAAKAVAEAFSEGGKKVMGAWTAFLKLLKKIWDAVTKAWRKLFKFLSDIFDSVIRPILVAFSKAFMAVVDLLMTGLTAVGDALAVLLKPLLDGLNSLMMFFVDTFSAVLEGFKAWNQAVTAVFSRIFAFFRSILEATARVYGNIFELLKKIPELVKESWSVVMNFFKNILKGDINAAFQGVFDFFKKLGSLVAEAFKPLTDILNPTNMKNVFAGVLQPFKDFFNGEAMGKIFKKAFDLSPLSQMFDFEELKTKFVNLFNELNPANVLGKIFNMAGAWDGDPGDVERLVGLSVPFVNFAQGGAVPGTAAVNGDSSINDKILAMLSPDEFVVPRSITSIPGMMSFLSQLVATGQIPSLKRGGVAGAFDDATGGGEDLFEGVKDAAGVVIEGVTAAFNPGVHLQKIKDEMAKGLRDMMKIEGFENGGSTGSGGVINTHPGEFVLRRDAVQGIGQSTASLINETGKLPGGKGSVSTTINFSEGAIVLTGVENPEQFVDELMDTIKRRSADGEEVMFTSGLRDLA